MVIAVTDIYKNNNAFNLGFFFLNKALKQRVCFENSLNLKKKKKWKICSYAKVRISMDISLNATTHIKYFQQVF